MKQSDLFEPVTGQNPACKDCELHKTTERVCVWGVGPKNAKIMIVGEAPGEAESRTGKPFQGKSGQLLRDQLRKAGINDDEVYITNVVKCRPPDNKTPSAKQQKACKRYLEHEIATVKPKYILTLGNPATKAIFGKAKITEVHGNVLSKDGIIGVPAFHPAYCLRDPSKTPVFAKDLKRFVDTTKGIKRKTSINWKVIGRSNLNDFLDEFIRSKWFSYDVESTGLNPHNPKEGHLTCMAFCLDSTMTSWVLPIHGPQGEFACKTPFTIDELDEEIFPLIHEIARKKMATGQFAKFDRMWIWRKHRVKFRLDFDTGMASHTLDENSTHGLKNAASFHFDAPSYDLTTKEKQGFIEAEKLYRYVAKDAYYTLCLKDVYKPLIDNDAQLARLFYRLVMRAVRAFFYIESNGLYINLDRFAKAEKDTRQELGVVRGKLDRMVQRKVPGKKVNWNSPAQVAEVLFGDFELDVVAKTGSGAPSTAEATLIELKDKHPIANLLGRYRELEKFLGTYLEGWKEFMVGPLMYMSYKLHGTVTGRYSSRIHQTPRDGTIRNVVTAPPGWTFVQGDFSQAELRVAAIVSRDPEMTKCFKEGIDIHWRTLLETIRSGGSGEYVAPSIDTAYKLMLERNKSAKRPGLPIAIEWLLKSGHERCIEIWKGWKEARKKAKGINFGFVYGMRENKFVKYAKTKYGFEPTLEEAETLRDAYFNTYRGLKPWHDRQKKLVKVDGYVTSFSGRRRRLPGIWSKERSMVAECERQAINSPIQGFIGDLKAMALVELVEKLDPEKAKVVGEVHDSILFWVRSDSVNEQLPIMKAIMNKPELFEEFKIDPIVPITCDFEVGDWGAGKTWRG
jgi:DNA polymerase-1